MDDNKAISLQSLICAIDNNNDKFKQWVLDTLSLIQEDLTEEELNNLITDTINLLNE